MTKETFKNMMTNPFGSTSWNKLDSSQYIQATYPNEVTIEQFSKEIYSTTDRIDELYLINKRKNISGTQFIYISDDDFRDYDICVQVDNRNS